MSQRIKLNRDEKMFIFATCTFVMCASLVWVAALYAVFIGASLVFRLGAVALSLIW